MTAPFSPAPEPPAFPVYRLREFLPAFLLGWGLGALLTFGVRALGDALLTTPCAGRTLLSLAMPLLLGPGGLGFTALSWRRPRRAALGLGLVVASLMPALYVGARDIGELRTTGCAGGYVVLATPGTRSVSTLSLRAGESRELTGRIGGYTPQTHPGVFRLASSSSTPSVVITLPKTAVRAGEVFPVRVSVRAGAPINTFTTEVQASQTAPNGRAVAANGSLEIDVRP